MSRLMEHKKIESEEEYQTALDRIWLLMDAEAETPEGEELESLGVLVEEYENEHYPIDPPSLIELIRFRLEQWWIDRLTL